MGAELVQFVHSVLHVELEGFDLAGVLDFLRLPKYIDVSILPPEPLVQVVGVEDVVEGLGVGTYVFSRVLLLRFQVL